MNDLETRGNHPLFVNYIRFTDDNCIERTDDNWMCFVAGSSATLDEMAELEEHIDNHREVRI